MLYGRPDIEIVSRLVNCGALTYDAAVEMVKLALVIIPVEIREGGTYPKDSQEIIQEIASRRIAFIPSLEGFPLHECVTMTQFEQGVTKHSHLAKIEILSDTEYRVHALAIMDNNGLDRLFWVGVDIRYDIESGEFRTLLLSVNGISASVIADNRALTMEVVNHMATLAAQSLTAFQIHSAVAARQDKYLIEIKPAPSKQKKVAVGKRGRLRAMAGPRVVYLNRLPANESEAMGKSGITPAAHQRKGYHVTLRAERFKYHKDYGIEKGHYRKPTWVGDRSTIVAGHIYTVIEASKPDIDD